MEKYINRFNELMDNGYEKKENEEIVQCLSLEYDGMFYNPAWFVSSEGYVLSVAKKKARILKPTIKFGGKKSKCENKITDFVKGYGQNIPDGSTPQYYFYKNSYGREKAKTVPMHQLMAHYFPEDYRDDKETLGEVHHKEPMNWNKPPQENNKASNLQIVTPPIHDAITNTSKLTDKAISNKLIEIKKLPHKEYVVGGEYINKLFEQLILAQPAGTKFYVGYCDDEGKVYKTEVHELGENIDK